MLRFLVLGALVAATYSALPWLAHVSKTPGRQLVAQRASPVQLASEEAAPNLAASVGALGEALAQVEQLKAQVAAGQTVAKFGELAESIVTRVTKRAGSAAPALESAVDGALQALFLQQLAVLRQQLVARFDKAANGDALSEADELFVAQAEELRRPSSNWSYEPERSALRSMLRGLLRRDALLAEEKAMAARTQQATISVIGRLQGQMELLQQKVQGMRGGSPWVLSTSYRIPKTPLQIVGKYQQGRANVEINLTPDKDPANSEGGFVEGFGPANLGVSFNVGI